MARSHVLDTSRPYRDLQPEKKGDSDWMEQDGLYYGWSESNVQYELAWWLYTEADTPLVQVLRRERPCPEVPNPPIPIPGLEEEP